MPVPIDTDLYAKAKRIADSKYKTHGAFKSGFIVKTYKELGGRYRDDGKPKNLKRWFKEEWKDVGGKAYPVYRPTKRISKDTPLTKSEIDPKDMKKKTEEKQKIRSRNLSPFKRR
jgi:Family of unknown function (DUF5872)